MAAPATAATHSVPAGGDLQQALDAARSGDTVLLASGATYLGNFKLPAKPATAYITIRTDAPANRLPAAGVRTSPADAAVLAKIKSPNSSPALSTAAGAHHWRFENVEFPATANGSGDIIALGGSAQTSTAQMPHTLVFDRVYVHGDPVVGQKRGISLQSGATEIINSYIADIKATGQEAQAICGWNGAGPYLIENNYLEGSAQALMFGGSDPSIPNLVPSDITVRRNLMSRPVAWQQEGWLVKTILELKNARRVLVEGNVIENVWKSGQVGFAITLTPRNQGGKAQWSRVEDVTIRHNVVRHAGGGVNLTGWDDEHASSQTQRVQIANNLFYDIDARWGGSGVFLQIGSNPRSVVVEHNTVVQSGTAVKVYGKQNGGPWPVDGFVFRDNLMRHNTYGVIGDNMGVGASTLNAYFTGLRFDHNVLAGGQASAYPANNYFPSVADFTAAFTHAAAEDFSLAPGSPFRKWASNAGAVGVDLAALGSAAGSAAPGSTPSAPSAPGSPDPDPPTAGDEDRTAVCRPGHMCETVDPLAGRRVR